MMHGALPLAASVVSLVQKSLNGVVSNWTLMFGYFCVTMSAMCSQAFFSTSEPDHMNQVRVTGPPEELPELEPPLLPPQAAKRIAAEAAARNLVRREIRMALLGMTSIRPGRIGVPCTRPRRSDRRLKHLAMSTLCSKISGTES